ncbi:MAG: hypothetical protein RLZZ450_4138, partial [Pseudomonadota bacterium]
HSTAGSRLFDLVLSSPVRTVAGTYSIGGAAAVSFTVSPGASLRVPLAGANGPASAYNTPEQKGVYLEADSPDLTVDHRETYDSEQYSETIKRDSIALGSRFRLGGYTLNREGRPNAGIDAVLIYAPTGGTITLTAPPGATLPFWSGSATAVYSSILTAGQTLAVRTVVAQDLDGALLTSTLPVSVSSGGRGWSTPGSCGDDGMDGLVPVTALGTEYVVRLPTGSSVLNNESRVAVIADVDATEVRIDGVLVTTLAAGGHYNFQPITLSYVQTSKPALVWMNGSLAGCELDTVLIPPIAFRPALTELSLDFNVLASTQVPPGEMAIVIATGDVSSIRLGGAVPTLTSSVTVPGRPALSYVRFNVTSGDTNVRAGSDFQALLATRTSPSGLLAYYNPYRIPGCGDGGIDPGETCDDGDLVAGDGCSATCTIEPGYSCSGTPSTCATSCGDNQIGAPIETCDDGNAVAGDGCNSNCRREVRISTPTEASRSNDSTPTVVGTSDPGIVVTVTIGTAVSTVTADSAGAWTFTPSTTLADGAQVITATGTDGRGLMSSATRNFSVDTSTTLAITAPSANSVTMDTTPTITGTGEVGATVTVSLDGTSVGTAVVAADGSWTLTVGTALTPGSKVVSAVSTDLAGNTGTATPVTFVIDTDITLTIATPASGAVLNNAMPTVSGTSEPGSTVSLMLTDSKSAVVTATATTAQDGSWSVAITTPLANGSVTVVARAMDGAGNMAQASSTFTIDAGTFVAIESPTAGSVVHVTTPALTGVGEPGAALELSLDGAPLGTASVDGSGRWTFTPTIPLGTGLHTVAVVATDTNGNRAETSVDFTVDTRNGPLLEIRNPPDMSRTSNTRPPFTGVADPGALVSVLIDDFFVETVTSTARGSWSLQLMSALPYGPHVLFVTTTDALGRTATDRHTFAVDAAVPAVTIVVPGTGSVVRDATPTISGTAQPGLRVQVLVDGTAIGEVTAGGDGSWTLDTPTLLSEGRHAARAVGDAGASPDKQGSYEVGFFVDTKTFVSILVPAEGGVVGSSMPVIAGVGEPGAMLMLSLDGTPAGNADVQADGSWSVAITVATPGAHRVSVRATDALGNEAQDENAFTYDPNQADTDGDGRPDREECKSTPCVDSDSDGISDERDPDDDGDGLPTANECSSAPCRDSDGDGKPNYLDSDDDDDGRPTSEEHNKDGTTRDTDHDGLPDHLDTDDDGDGLSTRIECAAAPCPDTDGDSTPDWLDPDDDNDGVPTARERDDGIKYGNNDTDGDGLVAWHDPDANGNGAPDGVDGLGDRDGDGLTDYIDLDTPPPGGLVTDEGFAIAGGGGCSAAPRGGRGANDALGALCFALASIALRQRTRRARI